MKAIHRLKESDYQIRLAVILFAAIAPFICILAHGVEPSISSYWRTDLQPLFIVANVSTFYYFIGIPNWRASALLILGLTAFSVDLYGGFHDALATVFFLVNLYPLYKTNHYKWVIWVYLISLPCFIFYGMLSAEIIAIEALCLHQGLVLRKLYNTLN